MLSVNEQVYGLSQIWSEAKYNYVFWNIRKNFNWDEEYQKVLEKVLLPMDLQEYYLELMKFISLLNDGHTIIFFPRSVYNGMHSLPFKIKYMNGKHIIVNRATQIDIPLFSEILEINGMNFDEYMKKTVFPHCWHLKPSSSLEQLYTFQPLQGDVDKNAYAFISILEKNQTIEFLTSNGVYYITPTQENLVWDLPTTMKSSETLSEIFNSEGLNIKITSDNIAIISLPTFMDYEMPKNFYKHFEILKSCKGFVIDVRDNGGGHSECSDEFSQAFIKGEFETGKIKHAVHIGAYKAWGCGDSDSRSDLSASLNKKIEDMCNNDLFEEEITSAHYPNCPYTFEQPVVILENALTGSSAENLIINFDSINRATIIGTPSYGSTGNMLIVNLPGGGVAGVCTRRYAYPNGKEFINIGIKPHIEAEFTQEDLMSGNDSVLDRGISEIRTILSRFA